MPVKIKGEQYFTNSEVSEELGVSRQTLWRHAPGEIRPGDVRAGLVVVLRRSLYATKVARPFSAAGAIHVGNPEDWRCRLFRLRYQAHAFEPAGARHQAGSAIGNLHRGEVGRVLVLEIETSGNTGSPARRIVGPCPLPRAVAADEGPL